MSVTPSSDPSIKKADSNFDVNEEFAPKKVLDDTVIQHVNAGDNDGESFDKVPEANRRIGTFSAVMLIANRMIGTGIFATPASIVSSTGSIGLALILWLVGAIIAGAGLAVYLEWASALPRSGGEKVYLEYAFRKPLYAITCLYGIYAATLGWPSGNSVYAGEMLLNAANTEVTRWNQRAIGVGVVTFALILHGCLPKWGLRLQNVLGIFKIGVLLFIIVAGFVALGGHVNGGAPNPSNFKNAFAGSKSDANSFVNSLYNVIWAFVGFSNAGYAMSEIRNPVKTIRVAAPLAMILVTILYMLVNVAFFAAVPKADIIASERLIASLFFERMFNAAAGRAVSVIIALSAIGNVLAVLFGQGRINQELGREGALPFSRFFASNKPFNAPLAGLALQWAVSLVIMLAPPGGDIYSFLLNLISYPLNIFNALVALGLIIVNVRKEQYGWSSPIKATLPVSIFYFFANLFLIAAPLVPPSSPANAPYTSLPYYLHCVVGFGIIALGFLYYLIWIQILPRFGGYQMSRREEVGSDGLTRKVFYKVKNE
ncbi:high-affinity methionine permease [Leucosporidium creatinivorum]|uniref:High-affinity methionine permease n=1 Tax=Leucosporidium creatinivorum TaxID=106004 RepID=A0A1Y2FYK0_9BASI|nr:high-affinity methionine permease [Leucosporidium creatinivorum]